jgi:hypothetical protein
MRIVPVALSLALALGVGAGLAPEPARAANGDAACRKTLTNLYLDSVSSEGTRGDAISDGYYGNEPNEVDGRTVPSPSPDPKVTDPVSGAVIEGASWVSSSRP